MHNQSIVSFQERKLCCVQHGVLIVGIMLFKFIHHFRTFWRKQLNPCLEDLHCPGSETKVVHVFLGAAVRDLACLHGGRKWQPPCWQTWFAALETVIVTGKCHCAVKEGERNFSLFTVLEIPTVGIVAAVRSSEPNLLYNRNKLDAII